VYTKMYKNCLTKCCRLWKWKQYAYMFTFRRARGTEFEFISKSRFTYFVLVSAALPVYCTLGRIFKNICIFQRVELKCSRWPADRSLYNQSPTCPEWSLPIRFQVLKFCTRFSSLACVPHDLPVLSFVLSLTLGDEYELWSSRSFL
jgi:hypothetical protein